MSWSPQFSGEVLLSTLTGQPAVDLGGGFGVRQVPLHPTNYGIPVPTDFVSAYKGVRVRVEFTGYADALHTGWFAYVYLGDRAYDTGQVGHLPGNLGTQIPSSPNTTFTGVLDFWFTATKFTPSPDDFAMWSGGGTWDIGAFGSGVLDSSSLNHANSKAELASSFLQVYMGQTATYQAQVTAVYVSEFPTADTPIQPPTIQPPTIYPPSGSYRSSQFIGITAIEGTIRYTTDGSEPTTSSAIFTRGFKVEDGLVVKAAAEVEGVLSATTTETYSIYRDIVPAVPSYRSRCLPFLLEQYKGDNP